MTKQKGASLLDRLREVDDLPSKIIVMDEWEGVRLKLRGLSFGAATEIEALVVYEDAVDKPNGKLSKAEIDVRKTNHARALATFRACLFDPDTDEPLFKTDQDVTEVLFPKSPDSIRKLVKQIGILNGKDEEEQKQLQQDFLAESESASSTT